VLPFFNGSSAFRNVFQLFSKLNIVCILSFKLRRNPRNPRENSPCFYRVIETRVFLAFDQSAPVFLKGYIINFDSSCIVITRSRILARVMTSKSVVEISVLPTAAKRPWNNECLLACLLLYEIKDTKTWNAWCPHRQPRYICWFYCSFWKWIALNTRAWKLSRSRDARVGIVITMIHCIYILENTCRQKPSPCWQNHCIFRTWSSKVVVMVTR
jgi:hypothetical protein